MFSLMLIPVFLVYSLILILAKPIFPRWTGAQFKQYGRSIWCVALFLLAPILTRLSWHSIWVVYPGTKREKNKFMCVSPAQEWIIEAVMSVQPLTPIGFYKGPGEPYSLVLCTLSTPEELQNRHPDKLGAMVSWLTSTYHAQIYSFAGILPSLLHKHNQWPTSMNPRSDRLVKGADATTFMVMENVLQVQERHKTDPLTKNIVIVGAGFIGSQVANKCAEMGLDVRALDIRMNVREKLDDRVKFYHEDVESAVKDAHLIVLLTMVGDDGVAGLMQYIESGMVIISDTHPKISKEIIYQLNTVGVTVYESALTREGVNFFQSYQSGSMILFQDVWVRHL